MKLPLTVQRTFELAHGVSFPSDTQILAPYLDERTCLRLRSTVGLRGAGGETAKAFRTAAGGLNPLDYLLVVSPSIARCMVVHRAQRPALEALIRGSSVEAALSELAAAGIPKPRAVMKDLLTRVVAQDYFSDSQPREYVPSGAHLHFYVTRRCNLRCKHCYMSAGSLSPGGELSTDERLRTLQMFAQAYPGGTVTFTGGEPLTAPDICRLLAEARGLGLECRLYTNGLLLSEQNIPTILASVSTVQVSLDGATANANDAIRGVGSFQRILAAVRMLDRAVVDRAPSQNYRIALTITPGNALDIREGLPRLLRRLKLRGNHTWVVGAAMRRGRARGNPAAAGRAIDMLMLESEVMLRLMRQGIVNAPRLDNGYTRTCGLGGAVTVAPDGGLYMCSILSHPVGHVRDADALERMQRIRDALISTNVDNCEPCGSCSLRYFCKGICRLTNLSRTGSLTRATCSEEFRNMQVLRLILRHIILPVTARVADMSRSALGQTED